MAIYHLSVKVISRSAGRSAVAAAAYRSASRLHDERLERDHDFRAKAGVVHSEILLPEGAPDRWHDRETLWNEVEARERQHNAQLAREVEIALPRELSRAEAVALARDFVAEQFVARGMVADLNVHWAVGADGEAQPHAHVMLTMRRIEPNHGPEGHGAEAGFGLKAREWNDRALLREWRQRWAEMANARLCESDHDARIDHRSNADRGIRLEPQNKIGPVGARRFERGARAEQEAGAARGEGAGRSEKAERGERTGRTAEHEGIARRNGERIAADPGIILDALTRQHSTFTRHDLARFVSRHTHGAEQFRDVIAVVEASPEMVRLGVDGRGRDRFTTREMLDTERRMDRAAADLNGRTGHGVTPGHRRAALAEAETAGVRLGEGQRHAFGHVTRSGDLSVVVGYAGTGKSTMLGVARQAWEGQGYRVRGAALSGIAAEGLEGGSGIPSRTLASLEWAWQEGRGELTARDVLVVDEAGMIGSRQMERVLGHARDAGAKVVLVGDPEQLQAIEAGAAFRAIAERAGAVEITEVRRQRPEWQREATRELATGRTARALDRYEQAGMVHGHATQDDARIGLVEAWEAERRQSPHQSRVMLAYTRADVAELNRLARERLREAGELGVEHRVGTERGERGMAAGDRVMFLRNERGLGAGPDGTGGVAVKNGTLGTVLAVGAGGERLTVRLDGPGPNAPMATFDLGEYGHVDHGYAATVHKAQGVTVDRAHVLANGHMDRHAAYVGLTRHRDGVELHWSAEELGDRQGLTKVLGRERAKDTSLDYGEAGPEPARSAAAYAERRGFDPLRPESEIVVARTAERRRPEASRPAAAQGTTQEAAREPARGEAVKRLTGPRRAEGQRRAEAQRTREARRSARPASQRPKRPSEPAPTEARPVPPRPGRRPEREPISQTQAMAEFADALDRAGLRLKGPPIMDGTRRRVQVEGDRKSQKSGSYVGYLDGHPAGHIQNFKQGWSETWSASRPAREMTAAERTAEKARVEAQRAAREAERERREAAVSRKAETAWRRARPAEAHPYLAKKGVAAHGMRQDDRGNLLVPMQDAAGRLWGVQTIAPDGGKLFMRDGRKTGTFAVLGEMRDERQPLVIAEGFATAATVREATGLPVVVAFDAGNLAPVAEAIRARDPARPLIFAADNDHHLPRRPIPLPNAGLEKARVAAAEVDGLVMPPAFGDGDPGTDWNDFAKQHGLDATRTTLEAFLKEHGIPMPDPTKAPEAAADERVERVRPATTQAQRDAARSRPNATRTPQATAQQQAMHDAQQASQRHQQQRGSGHGAGHEP